MVEATRLLSIQVRTAVDRLAVGAIAWGVVSGVPLHIMADKQIQQAIFVRVHPRTTRTPSLALNARGACHLAEAPSSPIAEQPAATDAAHVQVGAAIIVVISPGTAHSVHGDVQAGALGR